MNFTFEMIS